MQPNDEEKLGESNLNRFLKAYEIHRLHWDFLDRVMVFIIAALGLISALAWDETFKEIFRTYLSNLETLEGKLLYALILSLITAAVTVRLGKFIKKRSRK